MGDVTTPNIFIKTTADTKIKSKQKGVEKVNCIHDRVTHYRLKVRLEKAGFLHQKRDAVKVKKARERKKETINKKIKK